MQEVHNRKLTLVHLTLLNINRRRNLKLNTLKHFEVTDKTFQNTLKHFMQNKYSSRSSELLRC